MQLGLVPIVRLSGIAVARVSAGFGVLLRLPSRLRLRRGRRWRRAVRASCVVRMIRTAALVRTTLRARWTAGLVPIATVTA
ncbi:MAG TPA: hypothetical protein VLT79_12795, partial [Gemmatimonadales bacterium]|nr:hypothetical protein [Gemmatimonadales bacterium]